MIGNDLPISFLNLISIECASGFEGLQSQEAVVDGKPDVKGTLRQRQLDIQEGLTILEKKIWDTARPKVNEEKIGKESRRKLTLRAFGNKRLQRPAETSETDQEGSSKIKTA
jgi:hypothetical protein